MDKLIFGLSVTVVGMLIVFAGLVILIGCIKILKSLSFEGKKKAPQAAKVEIKDEPAKAEAPLAAAVAVQPSEQEQIIAVLTAAIAAVWEGEGGFQVRRVRRIQGSPAWQRAGREEQIYSRM